MRIVLFCHSLLSCWNNGNAHFLRGVVTELLLRGHTVRVYEPYDAWSVENLVHDHGPAALALATAAYPSIRPRRYQPTTLDLDEALDAADLVLVHEWNGHDLVQRIGNHRKRASSRYRLLFHDTHHRSVTLPGEMGAYDLSGFDGVLAFGAAIQEVYVRRGWTRRAWVWHEAADTRVFRPREPGPGYRGDVVWIGNWGDDERSAELTEMLLEPVRDLGLVGKVHGVRYPAHALARLERFGLTFGGWLPNFEAPHVFAQHTLTVHVPRRPYAAALPGIPTIRVFEALACGIPLVSAPWDDTEQLFTPGRDFLIARDGAQMRAHMKLLLRDADARRELACRGLEVITRRHTCAHRVNELLSLTRELGVSDPGYPTQTARHGALA